jgi:hypothetical protein
VEIVVTEVPLLELDDVTTVGMMAIGLGTARLETGGTSAIDVVSGVTLSAIAAIVPSLQAGLTCSFSFTVPPQCHSVILAHILAQSAPKAGLSSVLQTPQMYSICYFIDKANTEPAFLHLDEKVNLQRQSKMRNPCIL